MRLAASDRTTTRIAPDEFSASRESASAQGRTLESLRPAESGSMFAVCAVNASTRMNFKQTVSCAQDSATAVSSDELTKFWSSLGNDYCHFPRRLGFCSDFEVDC